MKSFPSLVVILCLSLVGCANRDDAPVESGDQTENLAQPLKLGDEVIAASVRYYEDFESSSVGWSKVAGPGFLDVVGGVFLHMTVGSSVWCEYAYTPATFGSARYQVDVFVDSQAVNTAFVWRAPDTSLVTETGGAYQATFNSSLIPGHFTFEKFDPLGRTLILDVPETFYGLNTLEIDDRGRVVTIRINGVQYGRFNVSSLTRPQQGYVVLVAGDLHNGDYFDNVRVVSYP